MHFHRIGWKKKIQPEISQVSKRFFFGLAFALFESWAHLEVVISNRDQCCGQILLDYHWVASAYFSRQAHYFQHFVSSYSDVQSQLAFRLLLLLRKLKLMLQEEFDHKMHFECTGVHNIVNFHKRRACIQVCFWCRYWLDDFAISHWRPLFKKPTGDAFGFILCVCHEYTYHGRSRVPNEGISEQSYHWRRC